MSTERAKAERKFWGIAFKDVALIVLGSLATILVAWFNSKSPHLRYTPADTVTFQGDKNRFGIISCAVTNDGSAMAEDVSLSFELAGSPFIEVKATPGSLDPDVRVENEKQLPAFDPKKPPPDPGKKGNRARIFVKNLNRGESFQVVAMVSNPENLPKRPEFAVRGKGVVGEMEGESTEILPAALRGMLLGLPVGIVFLIVSIFLSSVANHVADGKSGKQALRLTLTRLYEFASAFLGRGPT